VTETPHQQDPDEEHEPATADEPSVEETMAMEPIVDEPDGDEPEVVFDDPAIPERLTPDHSTFSEGLVGGALDPPPRVRAEFPVAFRGYDREVVDAHLAAIEEDVAELYATRSPQSAVRRELDRVGQETTAILQRAHEAAEEVTRSSRVRADARMDEAEREAERIRREAEARLKQIDKDTDEVWADRRRLLEDARSMGEALIRVAEQALERFPPAEDGGPPVEPPPRRPPVPERAATPRPPTPSPEPEPEPSPRLEEVPPLIDEADSSIESVRRIPRPGAPTHPRRPRR